MNWFTGPGPHHGRAAGGCGSGGQRLDPRGSPLVSRDRFDVQDRFKIVQKIDRIHQKKNVQAFDDRHFS